MNNIEDICSNFKNNNNVNKITIHKFNNIVNIFFDKNNKNYKYSISPNNRTGKLFINDNFFMETTISQTLELIKQ